VSRDMFNQIRLLRAPSNNLVSSLGSSEIKRHQISKDLQYNQERPTILSQTEEAASFGLRKRRLIKALVVHQSTGAILLQLCREWKMHINI